MSKTYGQLTVQEKKEFTESLKSAENMEVFFSLIQNKFNLKACKAKPLTVAMFAAAINTALYQLNPELK